MKTVTFDSLTLRAVVSELQEAITGAKVQDVRQVNRLSVALSLRSPGRTDVLALSCEASRARIHLADRDGLVYEPAGTFTMVLRKYIEGGVVAAVRQLGFDRIAEILVRVHGTERRLMLEIMGRHSNLDLVDADNSVLDCAKRIGPHLSRVRPLLPGYAYVPPPAPPGAMDPLSPEAEQALHRAPVGDPAALASWLRETFIGLSPLLVGELVVRSEAAGIGDAWAAVFGAARACTWQPIVALDEQGAPLGAYPLGLASLPASRQRPVPTVNGALGEVHRSIATVSALEARRGEAVAEIRASLRARASRREDALRRVQDGDRADTMQQWGDLLLTLNADYDTSAGIACVSDLYADGAALRIPLDPSRTAAENAESYYRKARRMRSAAEWGKTQVRELEAQMADLESALASVQQARDIHAIDACVRDLEARGLARTRLHIEDRGEGDARSSGPDRGIRRVVGPDGYEILVGLNAEGNDRLVRQYCAPHDFWFHVRANTSAHVVVRNPERRTDLPRAVVEAAALIAARNSRAKHSSYVTVDYTMGKYVRRPRGAAHGRVTYSHERTISVDPSADRP